MDSSDKNENKENITLNQLDKKGELEIISEEKNINCSEENSNNKCLKKLEEFSVGNPDNEKNKLKYSPKYLFENVENLDNDNNNEIKTCDLMNYLSDTKDKDKII